MKTLKKILNITQKTIVTVVFVASLLLVIRFFVADVYYVPTSSMQQTILTGEMILTDKLTLGARWLNNNGIKRLPGLGKIERNDIIVFNFPEGDTVFVNNPSTNYYIPQRRLALGKSVSETLYDQPKTFIPVLSRIAYVKRCVGLPGDTISIFNGDIFINNKKIDSKSSFQKRYRLRGDSFQIREAMQKIDIKHFRRLKENVYFVYITEETAERLMKEYPKINTAICYHKNSYIQRFPFYLDDEKCRGLDDYGPLYIPQKGDTIQINESNLPNYKRIIEVYENNRLGIIDNEISINGKVTNRYVIKQNYYFMVGDNRYGSIDSRNWGFVPEDHIIGKARMVLFSKDNNEKARWNRIGTMLN